VRRLKNETQKRPRHFILVVHHFSDDPRAWSRGQADKANLKSLYSTLTPDEKQQAIDTFTDKYLSMHDPKQFPGAVNNVKYLTTSTFKGAL